MMDPPRIIHFETYYGCRISEHDSAYYTAVNMFICPYHDHLFNV